MILVRLIMLMCEPEAQEESDPNTYLSTYLLHFNSPKCEPFNFWSPLKQIWVILNPGTSKNHEPFGFKTGFSCCSSKIMADDNLMDVILGSGFVWQRKGSGYVLIIMTTWKQILEFSIIELGWSKTHFTYIWVKCKIKSMNECTCFHAIPF